MMMLLDRLPACVYSQLLQDFLSLNDLCRLDSSLACRQSRAYFHLTLQTYPIVLSFLDVKDDRRRQGWEWLIRRGMAVRELHLRGLTAADSVLPSPSAHYFNKLNRLQSLTLADASNIQQIYQWLEVIRTTCHQLQRLTWYCNHLFVEDQLLVLSHCTGLKQLALHHAFNLSPECLSRIPSYCPQLEELSISQSKSLNASHLLTLLKSTAWQKSLKRLSFYNCYGKVNPNTGTELVDMMLSGAGLTVLEELNLSYSWDVTDDTLMKLLQRCPRLQTLSLRGCNIHIDHLEAISKYNPMLNSLDLSSCHNLTDDMLVYFLKQIDGKTTSRLQELHIGFCRLLTDNSLIAIGKYLKQLKQLTLEQRMFTDQGLVELSAGCHSLEELTLRYCFHFKHEGIASILKNNPSMKKLVLRECPGVTNATLEAIGQYCSSSLELLDLEGNKTLTEEGLLKVISKCGKLTSLNLNRCELVNDKVVKTISQYCPLLHELYLKRCSLLTDDCFLHLSACKRLRILDISFCTRLRLQSYLETFAKSCVRLEFLMILGSRICSWDDTTKKSFRNWFPEDRVKIDLSK